MPTRSSANFLSRESKYETAHQGTEINSSTSGPSSGHSSCSTEPEKSNLGVDPTESIFIHGAASKGFSVSEALMHSTMSLLLLGGQVSQASL